MKKLIYLTAISALALASCSKQEALRDSEGNEMEISAYMGGTITKSEKTNTTVPFRLYVTYDDSKYVPVTTMTYESERWKWGEGTVKYYWPADATKLEFYGIMDYAGGSTVTTRTIDTGTPGSISVSSVSGTEDLSVCYGVPSSATMASALGLTFNHAYTKFNFKLRAASGTYAYEITAMTVSARQTGTLTIGASPAWASGDPTGDAYSYTVPDYPTSKQVLTADAGEAFGELMIIPQSGVVLSVTYNVYADASSTTILSTSTRTATIDMSGNIGNSTSYILTLDGAAETKASTFSFTTEEGPWTVNTTEMIDM